MENYDCNQSAERVLMDASRKKNQNRNRLLFIVITITVGVIFSVFSLIYGKMEIDIQKNMKSRGSWLHANNLAKIADYLDCSVDYLLGRTDDPDLHKK